MPGTLDVGALLADARRQDSPQPPTSPRSRDEKCLKTTFQLACAEAPHTAGTTAPTAYLGACLAPTLFRGRWQTGPRRNIGAGRARCAETLQALYESNERAPGSARWRFRRSENLTMSADSAMGIPLFLLSAQVRGLTGRLGVVVRDRIELSTFRFSGQPR